MRGYFAIGVEGISKPLNLGNLMRSAHAFGASFFFVVDPAFAVEETRASDTSDSSQHLPLYVYHGADELTLPRGCALVGVELSDDAIDLPSFPHPMAAAYVLGPERGSLSPALIARCDHVVKIPTKFCVNVGVAGAIVMYDRMLSLGRFARRPLNPRARPEPPPPHVRGAPVIRRHAGASKDA
ncbi:MAG: RNA methyltransferase [Alphaproteobacteria bacterium]|nr:MAG: RNA methyltransferase [Alphaproteobacteria bacterium]